MNKELDCRGLACPQPVILTRKLLNDSSPDSIDVIVDNAAAVENVSRFLTNNHYKVSTDKKNDAEWIVKGIKTQEAPAESPQAPDSKTLVLITTETLGRGDEELGTRLMETFIGTLSELGDSLWRIVFLNGGVKLVCRQGSVLESLQKLASSGTDIFVCGTCLMHYGLMEQKAIGETTNMMDIMTSLALAEKVIRP